ncbi:DUF1501 domain-containing protein [Roseateles amylovorans]|uniref:DUF1501 domain-containing protein n=1 Tax=Roseateles amylovorans TaxID=2978473 RepID=A0ABY6B6F1_9BURK|nr:DUF1501 domain-containing protein [Roseateles amylovorans]UXH80336.1 DUF1501 domain-containing protein [Roseateles amylovorans]
MHHIDPKKLARRAFLQRASQMAALGTAMPLGLTFAAMGDAAAQSSGNDDYKALVCLFLFGGNDDPHTFVPHDLASYLKYSAIRGGSGEAGGGIALRRSDQASTVMTVDQVANGRVYAMNPLMRDLWTLQNEGKVALQQNVGPLIVPLTRAQYFDDPKKFPRPGNLFSHDSQVATWSSFEPTGREAGWVGRIGDLMMAQNPTSFFTTVSVSGSMTMISGRSARTLNVGNGVNAAPIHGLSSNGPMLFGSSSVTAALEQMAKQARTHVLENDLTSLNKRASDAVEQLNKVYVRSNPAPSTLTASGMRKRLGSVARMIAARSSTSARRQVFFVLLGGFDVHDNLLVRQAALLRDVNAGVFAFHRHMEQLGLGDKVTLFTASDFGRTMASNGDGTDHGWGGNHMIVGGAVKGKERYYGKTPVISVSDVATGDGFDGHVGRGRLLPTTSVEQYAATLAKWFGVPASQIPEILPNLRNFGGTDYPIDLGFMR